MPYNELKVGSHEFCVFAVGSGGQTGSPACYTWTVDQTPPAVTITRPSSGELVPTPDPVFTGKTNEPASTINLFVDGSSTSAGSVVADAQGDWTFNKPLGLSDKQHTVSATATDPAGNVGVRSAEVSFSVAAHPQETTLVEHPQSVHSSRHSVFEFGSPTGATRFDCQLDNAASYTECEQVALFKNLGEGTHSLRVRAKDSAGNVDPSPVEFSWKVDTQSPSVCSPGGPGAEPQGGCASSGGRPTLASSLLGGLLLALAARRRRVA
ncbi:MAG: Ig-like domain-containing protein [Cystobacter sp.]